MLTGRQLKRREISSCRQSSGLLTGGSCRTIRTANKLDSVKAVNAARLQHGKAAQQHSAVDTRSQRRVIPRAVRRALLLIMDVVEHAVIWHEQSIALERTNCTITNITARCQCHLHSTNYTVHHFDFRDRFGKCHRPPPTPF